MESNRHLYNLAYARQVQQERMEAVEKAKQEVEASEIWQIYTKAKEALADVSDEVHEWEDAMRQAVLSVYEQTGEKQYPGANVKLFMVRKYDPTDALNWCMDHNVAQALKLDKRQFDKIAGVMKPDFVEFGEEPRVYIDGDLSEFLEGE